MNAQISSVFLYVDDVMKSLEFYNEVMGAEVRQCLAEDEGVPPTLAILQLGDFTLMLHSRDDVPGPAANGPVGVGIHLQMQVPDIEAFHAHCIDQGAMLSLSGEPVDQEWGWKEVALRDPDGYIWSVYEDTTGGYWA